MRRSYYQTGDTGIVHTGCMPTVLVYNNSVVVMQQGVWFGREDAHGVVL